MSRVKLVGGKSCITGNLFLLIQNHIGIPNALEIYLLCLPGQSHAHYNTKTPAHHYFKTITLKVLKILVWICILITSGNCTFNQNWWSGCEL